MEIVFHTVCSVQFSRSLLSDSLQLPGLQLARPPCPSPTPEAYSNSCPSSQWCHPTVPSSVVPFSSRLQSFRASRSFPVSQFFASGGQSTGASASASLLPMNIPDWFPLGLVCSLANLWTVALQASLSITKLLELAQTHIHQVSDEIQLSKGLSRVFSNTTVQNHQFFNIQLSFMVQLSRPHITTRKIIALTRWAFVIK